MATNPILSHVIRKCSVDCWFRDNMLRKSVDIPRYIIVDYKFLIYAYALKNRTPKSMGKSSISL
jgi:hypothetical protein